MEQGSYEFWVEGGGSLVGLAGALAQALRRPFGESDETLKLIKDDLDEAFEEFHAQRK